MCYINFCWGAVWSDWIASENGNCHYFANMRQNFRNFHSLPSFTFRRNMHENPFIYSQNVPKSLWQWIYSLSLIRFIRNFFIIHFMRVNHAVSERKSMYYIGGHSLFTRIYYFRACYERMRQLSQLNKNQLLVSCKYCVYCCDSAKVCTVKKKHALPFRNSGYILHNVELKKFSARNHIINYFHVWSSCYLPNHADTSRVTRADGQNNADKTESLRDSHRLYKNNIFKDPINVLSEYCRTVCN